MSRKTLIIEKAMDLFAQRGIGATTVQDITDACGISKGAFYLAFRTKEELVVAIVDSLLARLLDCANSVLGQPLAGRDMLRRFIHAYLRLFHEHASFLVQLMREQFQPDHSRLMEKIRELDRSLEECLLIMIDRTYVERAASTRYDLLVTIRGLLHGYSEFIVKHPQSHDLEKLAAFLMERIDCVAEHHPEAFITPDMWNRSPGRFRCPEPDAQDLRQLIESFRGLYGEDPLVEETLELLSEELAAPAPRRAILKGLLANLMPYREFAFLVFSAGKLMKDLDRN